MESVHEADLSGHYELRQSGSTVREDRDVLFSPRGLGSKNPSEGVNGRIMADHIEEFRLGVLGVLRAWTIPREQMAQFEDVAPDVEFTDLHDPWMR